MEENNTNQVQEAKELLERIEQANKKTEELLARQERLAAEAVISGESEAGQTTPKKKTDDELADEEAEQLINSISN